jgi:transcriptional regulator with XRE-family HTH domain
MRKHRKASPEIRRRLASNCLRLRKANGYTQHQLARLCGFPNSYISEIECETVNITLANVEALADGLDCSLHGLLMKPPGSEQELVVGD